MKKSVFIMLILVAVLSVCGDSFRREYYANKYAKTK